MNTSNVPLLNGDHSNQKPGRDRRLLDIAGLSKNFGGIRALAEVTFSFRQQEGIVSMIGPNGAGKTTFVNVVTGILAPDEGKVYFQGQNITRLPAHTIPSFGIARTFQLVEVFNSLTVLENAMVGCHVRSRAGILASGFSLPSARAGEKQTRDEAMENLKMVGLEHKASESITALSLGERKLVGIARALGICPILLMLDEPVGGLAAHEVKKIVELIDKLLARGVTVFIVEHNMPFVMSISERVIVLDQGRKIADDTPNGVRANDAVIKAYLGEEVGGV